MNNYINKFSRLYIEQRNCLSEPLVKDHILSYSHKQTELTLIRQLFKELPDLGLLCEVQVNFLACWVILPDVFSLHDFSSNNLEKNESLINRCNLQNLKTADSV